MNKFFSGSSQTTFTRHSALDNGTYVTFKDASKDQESPFSAFAALLGMAAIGFFGMCVLTAWGY